MDEISLLKKKLEREKAARKQAENILETKARELFDANESLKALNQDLEAEIAKRTKSLKESELRYRILVEQAKDLIYNIDHEGYFLFVNSIGIERFGYVEEQIVGKRYIEFIPEEDIENEFAYYTKVRDEGYTNDYHEFRVKSKDGELIWLGQNVSRITNPDGSFYFTAVARDITKRKLAEKQLAIAKLELEKSEIKYRSIIENMDLGLMEVDTNGIILRVYEKFNEMLGYEDGELIGKSANEILLVEGFEKVLNEQDSNRIKGQTGVYEVKIKKKDGTEIWVLISGAPFFNEKGEVIGSIGVHYDITDRKELQAQLEVARRKAVKAQQAEKAFLANMSHEIRTPLNAIIGMSHLLQDTDLDKEQADFLNVLSSSANILKSLISDILDISKIDAGSLDIQRKPFDVRHLINQLITTFSLQKIEDELEFTSEVDSDLDFAVESDPQLINQILLNLLSNAQKFTEKGSIKLSVELIDDGIETAALKFNVQDTGIGVSKEDLSIIFNEFKQANSEIRSKYGGTGLGLSISNQLVKLLGGELKVDSSPGKGSSFYFTLRVHKAKSPLDLATPEERMERIVDEGRRILVVEDNPMNLKYISSLLKKWKMDFSICYNGQEACELIDKNDFDLIFMDLQMPIMDGFEATEVIRNRKDAKKNTPIVALTASTFLSKKRLALKAGMSDFLSKPFTPNQLFQIISKYLGTKKASTSNEHNFVFSSQLDVDYLKEAYEGDHVYAKEMFETYLEIIEDELLGIKNSIEDKDIGDIKNKLHKIKPIFTMVGLTHISKDIEHGESIVTEQNEESISQWFGTIESEIRSYLPVIKNEVEKLRKWQKN